jgi:hypothetical protein
MPSHAREEVEVSRRQFDFEMAMLGDRLTREGLSAYGSWIAGLAPWSDFITLTHDPKRLARPGAKTWSQVGPLSHRRRVRFWLREVRKRIDPGLRWWSEMERLPSGACHEHSLAVWSERAPVYSALQFWFDLAGAWDRRLIADGSEKVAAYIGKYGGKSGAFPPLIVGLGVHERESHSVAALSIVGSR